MNYYKWVLYCSSYGGTPTPAGRSRSRGKHDMSRFRLGRSVVFRSLEFRGLGLWFLGGCMGFRVESVGMYL